MRVCVGGLILAENSFGTLHLLRKEFGVAQVVVGAVVERPALEQRLELGNPRRALPRNNVPELILSTRIAGHKKREKGAKTHHVE